MQEKRHKTLFKPAAQEVLQYLQMRFGFGLWMVTRTTGADWVVLAAEDRYYSVRQGDVFNWNDSFCSRMVRGEGPRIAPVSAEVPAYAEAPIGKQVSIGAYVGVPLNRADGELFGTLCAIDPHPQPEVIERELPQIELIARLLETILESDLTIEEEHRRAERAEAEAMTDVLTGLFNRRGWDKLIEAEEVRCVRYSHPAAVISVDLDELKLTNDEHGHAAGDKLLQTAGHVIAENVRKTDIAARVGGDEFSILAVECHQQGVVDMTNRLGDALAEAGVAASIGYGVRSPHSNLAVTSEAADVAMYENKRKRKAQTRCGNEVDPSSPAGTLQS